MDLSCEFNKSRDPEGMISTPRRYGGGSARQGRRPRPSPRLLFSSTSNVGVAPDPQRSEGNLLSELKAVADCEFSPEGTGLRSEAFERRQTRQVHDVGFSSETFGVAWTTRPALITGPKYFGGDFLQVFPEADQAEEDLLPIPDDVPSDVPVNTLGRHPAPPVPDARVCTELPRDELKASLPASSRNVSSLLRPEVTESTRRVAQGLARSHLDPLVSGPAYCVPDIVYAPSDVDPGDVLHVPDSPQSSQQNVDTEGDSRVASVVRIVSWNVAGISAKRVKTLIAQDLSADVVALQEYPKMPAGWHLHSGERYSGLIYQNYFMYRAVALMYDAKKFHLKGRRADERGIWLRLQHVETSKHVWVGSVHLPNNQPRDECKRLMSQFVGLLPAKAEAAIALGDYNTHFRWNVAHEACIPSVIEPKWGDLRQVMAEKGLQQLPPVPSQAHTPTFHSRKQNVSTTQIDGAFLKGFAGEMTIVEESRVEVGTDHDRLEIRGTLLGPGKPTQRVRAGGPMRVVSSPPPTGNISTEVLMSLAKKHCRPAILGVQFRASAATSTLREIAKAGRDPQAWKHYLGQLRQEKVKWKGERIERASSDWGLFRALTKAKKAWGDEYMITSTSEDPVNAIKEHFEKVFHDDSKGDVYQELMQVSESLNLHHEIVPFSAPEVREAIMKGKNGKATGPDCIPTELLKHMMEHPQSVEAFVEFFNGILCTGDVPRSWDQSVVSLLPKVSPPRTAKQLRPIALASHVSKAYARLVVKRLECELMPQGPHQLAGKRRQAADFLWVATRLTHLCREWKADCYLLKLDLQRAFDSVCRVRLARKLCQWSGLTKPHETRSLVRLLASSDLVLHLPWEQHGINSNIGVKQGATESPLLFARLLDDVMCDVGLEDDEKILPDLPRDSAVYMDDVLAWKCSIKGLQAFVDKLLPKLSYFGLAVQPAKSKLLCLRGSKVVPLTLDGMQVYPMPEDETFSVMNLPLSMEGAEQKILEALVDKARAKFFGILHILCSNAPFRARLKVLEVVVFGSMRWCLGVLVPTPPAQRLLNFFHCNCVRRMLGIRRGKGELWVDFEARSLRMARAKIYEVSKLRWGDRHLQCFWRYTGHVVREGQRDGSSVAGLLAHFRTLPWWNEQQGEGGVRRRRHFPFLMNSERKLAGVIGSPEWRVATANREQWQGFEKTWMQREGIPWTSGRQPALTE